MLLSAKVLPMIAISMFSMCTAIVNEQMIKRMYRAFSWEPLPYENGSASELPRMNP